MADDTTQRAAHKFFTERLRTLQPFTKEDLQQVTGWSPSALDTYWSKQFRGKERRNWWDVLAGGKDGAAMVVAGHEFTVLRAAQIRQAKPVTSNALCRNENEQPPDARGTGRWPKAQLPVKATRAAKKKITRKIARARAS